MVFLNLLFHSFEHFWRYAKTTIRKDLQKFIIHLIR